MYINWKSHRKFIHPKYRGIIFENYITDNSSVNNLLGEHIDQINARKLLHDYHNKIDLNALLATGKIIYKDDKNG
jgi:hypothetical protein